MLNEKITKMLDDLKSDRHPKMVLTGREMHQLRAEPDRVEGTLRGKPFIGRIEFYDNVEDVAYGQWIPRECDKCYFRLFDGNRDGDCHIEGDTAKLHFGFKPEDFLPPEMDGKKVGNYCPHFADFRGED